MSRTMATQASVAPVAARWLAQIQGEQIDVAAIREQIPASIAAVEEINGQHYLASPDLDASETPKAARSAATDLVRALNISIGLVYPDHKDLQLGVIAEWKDGSLVRHHTMTLEPGIFRLRGGCVKPLVDGVPYLEDPSERTTPDRAFSLLQSNPHVREALNLVHKRDADWADIYIIFETIKRLTTPADAKPSHQTLMSWDWAAKDELDQLYDTANFHRHGFPRSPLRHPEMSIEGGRALVRRLMARLVIHLT